MAISGDTGGDGTGDVQVFVVNSGVTAELRHLTVTKGYTTVKVTDSTFSTVQLLDAEDNPLRG